MCTFQGSGIRTLVQALGLVAMAFVCGVAGAVLAAILGADAMLLTTAGTAVGAVAGLFALSWQGLLGIGSQTPAQMLRLGWWPLAISYGLFCMELWGMVATGSPLAPNWMLNVCSLVALCLLTGLAEESMFRGLVLGGILNALGNRESSLRRAAILCALVFGLLHIEWWDIDYTNAFDLVQALLKTLQTGLLGFYLAAITIRTHSIVCPVLVHGASNFFLMLCAFGLMGAPIELDYVSSGEDAWATMAMYVVVIALYAPLVPQGLKLLGKQDKQESE